MNAPDNAAARESDAVDDVAVPVVEDGITAGTSLLYTPAQAAQKLAVPESWLRRKAGRRVIPCTLLGKHLRFSDNDLRTIVASSSRPAGTRSRRPPRPRTRRPRRSH